MTARAYSSGQSIIRHDQCLDLEGSGKVPPIPYSRLTAAITAADSTELSGSALFASGIVPPLCVQQWLVIREIASLLSLQFSVNPYLILLVVIWLQ